MQCLYLFTYAVVKDYVGYVFYVTLEHCFVKKKCFFVLFDFLK